MNYGRSKFQIYKVNSIGAICVSANLFVFLVDPRANSSGLKNPIASVHCPKPIKDDPQTRPREFN